jgi:hypothetical protein
MTAVPNSSARLTCHCSAVSESGALLSASLLPADTELCHCNPCRYSTGSLAVSFLPLSHGPSIETLSRLTAYRSSAILTRFFCSICGCQCFLQHHQPHDQWYCLSGVVEQSPESKAKDERWPTNIVRIHSHQFVSDTVDDGLTPCWLSLGGRSVPAWSMATPENRIPQRPQDLKSEKLAVEQLGTRTEVGKRASAVDREATLEGRCLCGGVSLSIKRAGHTTATGESRAVTKDPNKFLTYLCACRSCRLTTGTSLVPFALVPPSQVLNGKASFQPIIFGRDASNSENNPNQTLKHYRSSPDTWRSFCGACGATVFYFCEQRPKELDLATGILRAEDGSMAKAWLEWEWGRCSFPHEGIDQELVQAWQHCRVGDS